MRIKHIIITVLVILGSFTAGFGQASWKNTQGKPDQALRGSGRVNPSTLGMEMDISLGGYSGRGIGVPVSLSYSSKSWRLVPYMSYRLNTEAYRTLMRAKFAEESASGWSVSTSAPYIEYTGENDFYDGFGNGECSICIPNPPSESPQSHYIQRLTFRGADGSSHELLADKVPRIIDRTHIIYDWNGEFYATDGSNLHYTENSNSFVLRMTDGSYYIFGAREARTNGRDDVRRAISYTDANGNSISYNQPNTTFPTGSVTDTMGRNINNVIPTQAPTTPTIQSFTMPGLSQPYKFYWKKLQDTTAEESALTTFSTIPIYAGSVCGNSVPPLPVPSTILIGSNSFEIVCAQGPLDVFNPTLLTKIELPNGQSYRFSYNEFAEIDRIYYPTGSEERFEYDKVPTLTNSEGAYAYSNRGVKNRKVFATAGIGTPYEWTYSVDGASNGLYTVTINNPDGTKNQRFLPQSSRGDTDNFGFEDKLAGMAYEERSLNSLGQIVSKKLTNWTKTAFPVYQYNLTIDSNPRVASEESIIYDTLGNGLSTTSTIEYEGDLTQRETPLLAKKSSQYKFVTVGSPLPATPERVSETQYLQSDSSVLQTTKDIYKSQNMVGLATSAVVKDGSGNIVSRSEMSYDDSTYSPNIGRGNPTTSRVWDSTKGTVTNPSAYITTRAKFDWYGNLTESTDAKGNVTKTYYDSTFVAFPIKVVTPIADPTGASGSNTSFETTVTYDYTTGLPLTTTDANGQTTSIEYDAATLRPKKVTPPTGAGTSETIYNDVPNNYWVKNRTQIDANNWAESITYFDGLGRAFKSEKVDADGNIFSETEFDFAGRPLRTTNPYRANEAKQWTTNVYDEQSRVKQVTLPGGATVKTDFGVATTGILGITKQITDQAGKKRKGISDALGRMVRVIEDPTGQNLATDYVFDTLGNLRKTIQGEQSRYFTYDSLGRLLYAKQPEQEANTAFAMTDSITNNSVWSVKYQYDDNGNIVSTTDARGVSVSATYDNFNRLKLRDYSAATPDVNSYYDGKGLGATVPNYAKGKTTKVTSSVSETRYTSFDNLGKLLTGEQRTPFVDTETIATATPRVSSYQYNAFGALISETYPSGRTVKYEFNQDGEIARIGGTKGTQNTLYANAISYNSAGSMERLKLGNGKWETAKYNERLQVTQVGLGNSATDTSLLKLEFGYGTATQNNGAMRSQKISFNGLTQPFEQTYAYDDLNRLQSSTETINSGATTNWKQTFQYDRFGNRRFDAANTTTLTALNSITNPLIDTSNNRFSSNQNYAYDKTGNLTQDAEGKQFLYDAENHQKEVKVNGVSVGIYLYDGDGRRVKKISDLETTIFVYNGGGQLVAEYSTQQSSAPQVSYLTQDHLGSPRIITDNVGKVIARKDFNAFGDETNSAQRTELLGYKPEEIRQDYTGYQKDDESGLEFAQARYYNTKHGRFTSVDPLTASANVKDPQTFNRYSYAMNSPYKFTDPLGLVARPRQSSLVDAGAIASDARTAPARGTDPIVTGGRANSTPASAQAAEPPMPKPKLPEQQSTPTQSESTTIVVSDPRCKRNCYETDRFVTVTATFEGIDGNETSTSTGQNRVSMAAFQSISVMDENGAIDGTVTENVVGLDGNSITTNRGTVETKNGTFPDFIDAKGRIGPAGALTDGEFKAQTQILENTPSSTNQRATFSFSSFDGLTNLNIVQTRSFTNIGSNGQLNVGVDGTRYRFKTEPLIVTQR
jgi:RHS repeat-associated protein